MAFLKQAFKLVLAIGPAALLLDRLGLMAGAPRVIYWAMAGFALWVEFFMARMVWREGKNGQVHYKKLSWKGTAPDLVATRRDHPKKFWLLIAAKIYLCLFIFSVAMVFVLFGLGYL